MKTRKAEPEHTVDCDIRNEGHCICGSVKPQPTPTPWHTVKARTYVHIQDERGNCVASCAYEEAEVNAAFIVRAVNSHEELLRVLKACVDSLNRDTKDFGHEVAHINYAIRDAEAAIAKAEGV